MLARPWGAWNPHAARCCTTPYPTVRRRPTACGCALAVSWRWESSRSCRTGSWWQTSSPSSPRSTSWLRRLTGEDHARTRFDIAHAALCLGLGAVVGATNKIVRRNQVASLVEDVGTRLRSNRLDGAEVNQSSDPGGETGLDDIARSRHVDGVHLGVRFPPRRDLPGQVKDS